MKASLICNWIKALSALAVISCPATSFSAELPHEFVGVWSVATATDNQCKKSDWEHSRNDRLLSVAASTIVYWETTCKISSVKKLDGSTIEAHLTCRGEGMMWRSHEVWHVQKIGLRKQFVSVALGRSAERDGSGKRVTNQEGHKISVSIYLQCQ